MATYEQCLQKAEKQLREHHIDNAAGDSWMLLSYVTGWSRVDYLMNRSSSVDEQVQRQYEAMVEKRADHVPLQYITGVQNFFGYDFKVTKDVLIPRYDTEVLIEKMLQTVQSPKRILDLCTGSGCIAITLVKEWNPEQCVAVDISPGAIHVARENAENLQAEVEFLLGDLFQPVNEKAYGTFDVIVSNPPYIPSGICEELMEEVKEHEPRLALDGKEDGLFFYRRIIEESGDYLNSGGWIFFEIGHDQGKAVADMLKGNGFINISVYQDLAGLDRVVCGKYMDSKHR